MSRMVQLNLLLRFLRNAQIKDAVHDLLARDGLILGYVMVFKH